MKQLINFLREACCQLKVSSFTDNSLTIVLFRGDDYDAVFDLNYLTEGDNIVLTPKLEDQIRAFLRSQSLENLHDIYKHNHYFIDYCVDNGWLIREEKITHQYNEGYKG